MTRVQDCQVDEWLVSNLVCPRDLQPLQISGAHLRCQQHEYAVVEGVPIMLLAEDEHTMGIASNSLEVAKDPKNYAGDRTLFVDTLGINEQEKAGLLADAQDRGVVDPVVKFLIGATCGHLYDPLVGHLEAYPIPKLRLPAGRGKLFLDLGCSWGRWCIAAGKAGYQPVGIDPSLGAVLAAKRVSRQLGIDAKFIVADARRLPFRKTTFDVVFSYSVLQHFSHENVVKTVHEIARVLKLQGTSLVQMACSRGLRSQFHLMRRRWHAATGFEVRYWNPGELLSTFRQVVGPSNLSVDGYFGLGIQASDKHLLPRKYQLIVNTSEFLRALSAKVPAVTNFADSLYVSSVRE